MHFCKAECSRQKAESKAKNGDGFKEAKPLYAAADPYPPALRRLGQIAYQEAKYQEAADRFLRANVCGDFLAIEGIVSLACKLTAQPDLLVKKESSGLSSFWSKKAKEEKIDVVPMLEAAIPAILYNN